MIKFKKWQRCIQKFVKQLRWSFCKNVFKIITYFKFINLSFSCSVNEGVLKNFGIFTGKHLSWSLKNRLQHKCFPTNIEKFLRTSILQKHLQITTSIWPDYGYQISCTVILWVMMYFSQIQKIKTWSNSE